MLAQMTGVAIAIVAIVLAAGVALAEVAGPQKEADATTSTRVTNPPPTVEAISGSGVGLPLSRNVGSSSQPPVYLTYKTPFEFYLTLLTIGLAVFLSIVLSFMARKSGITDDFIRSFMVVVIVFAALFLVVAGYSDEQTAPVFGLLGTIAGYIFGRSQRPTEAESAADGSAVESQEQVTPKPDEH